MKKRTVIVGASTSPSRYSYLAAQRLVSHGHEIIPLGIREGNVAGSDIIDLRSEPDITGVNTVTLYINPARQSEWQEYLLSLKPERIIFNPGTENISFETEATKRGIETVQGCTLVMLSAGTY